MQPDQHPPRHICAGAGSLLEHVPSGVGGVGDGGAVDVWAVASGEVFYFEKDFFWYVAVEQDVEYVDGLDRLVGVAPLPSFAAAWVVVEAGSGWVVE